MDDFDEIVEVTLPVKINIMKKGEATKIEAREIAKAVCAISNTGRYGVIKMINAQHQGIARKGGQYDTVTPKHLDQWKTTVEGRLMETLRPEEWVEGLNFSSEPPTSDILHLHVEPVSTLLVLKDKEHTFNLRLPTDSSTIEVGNFEQAINIMTRTEKRPREREYFDYWEYFPSYPNLDPSDDMKSKASKLNRFPWFQDLKLGDKAPPPESKVVQYKKIADGPGTEKRVEKHVTDYVGAFANYDGGLVCFGVDDNTLQVVGQKICEGDEEKIIGHINMCVKRKIWGFKRTNPERGKHWDVVFRYLGENKCLIGVTVEAFYGGVFQKEPESYILEKDGQVVRMGFEEWADAMMKNVSCSEDTAQRDEEMRQKFEDLSLSPNCGHRIFAIRNCLEHIQAQLFQVTAGLNVQPVGFRNIIPADNASTVDIILRTLKERYNDTKGLVVCSTCLSVDLGKRKPLACKDVVCDMFVCSEVDSPYVIIVAKESASMAHLQEYLKVTIQSVQRSIRNHGGRCFYVKGCIVTPTACIEDVLHKVSRERASRYPESFHQMHEEKVQQIVRALVISLAAFTPDSFMYDRMGLQVMNLLTTSQLRALQLCRTEDSVLIQGYPGTGKTVVAMERIKELRRAGAAADEILYMSANEALASFIGRLKFPKNCGVLSDQPLCRTVHEEMFLREVWNESDHYESVKHIFIDEAHNFENYQTMGPPDENLSPDLRWIVVNCVLNMYILDWFKMVRHAVRWQSEVSIVILGDPSQKLDSTDCQSSYVTFISQQGKRVMLQEIIRNSKEIVKFMKEHMEDNYYSEESFPTVAHDFMGTKPEKSSCEATSEKIYSTVDKYIRKGFEPNDIAILVEHWEKSAVVLETGLTRTQHDPFTALNSRICVRETLQKVMEYTNDATLKSNADNFIDIKVGRCCVDSNLTFFVFTTLLAQERVTKGPMTLDEVEELICGLKNKEAQLKMDCVNPPNFLNFLHLDGVRKLLPGLCASFINYWAVLCMLFNEFFLNDPKWVSASGQDLVERGPKRKQLVSKEEAKYGKTWQIPSVDVWADLTNLELLCMVTRAFMAPVRTSQDLLKLLDVFFNHHWNAIHIGPNVHAVEANSYATSGAGVIVDTVDQFSGLEKAVIIGIIPEGALQEYNDFQEYKKWRYMITLVSRARARLEIISVPSKPSADEGEEEDIFDDF